MMRSKIDISYENSLGEAHSFRVLWQESFGLVSISFYDETKNRQMFEEELSRETAIALRDRLTRAIRAAESSMKRNKKA